MPSVSRGALDPTVGPGEIMQVWRWYGSREGDKAR